MPTAFDPYTNRVPLGMLTANEIASLVECATLEVFNFGTGRWVEWTVANMLISSLPPSRVVRAKAEKPYINWSHVSSVYSYLAQNGDGKSYLYETEPVWVGARDAWLRGSGSAIAAAYFASFKPGNGCKSKDSIVSRKGK